MILSKHIFRNISFVLLIIFFVFKAQSQVGINGRFINPNLSKLIDDRSEVKSGFGFGVDSWFRLKKKRIEFMPELGLEFYKVETFGIWPSITEMSSYYFMFKTNFYLLNFNEDCNCPTFSKDGNTISKGFYLSVAPEIKYINRKSDIPENDLIGGVVIGAGLDIGVTELLTITPNIGYELTSKIANRNYSALQLGLRAGLRFNDGKKKFRR